LELRAAISCARSFIREDEIPVVGRKYHMACHGVFHLEEDGVGVID
jgi:hypothetical protein